MYISTFIGACRDNRSYSLRPDHSTVAVPIKECSSSHVSTSIVGLAICRFKDVRQKLIRIRCFILVFLQNSATVHRVNVMWHFAQRVGLVIDADNCGSARSRLPLQMCGWPYRRSWNHPYGSSRRDRWCLWQPRLQQCRSCHAGSMATLA